jgi:hypothetical protein
VSDERERSEAASEQGRFAARAFVGRWSRETGEKLSPVASERMQFAYETGYMRGRSDAMRELMKMFDQQQEGRKTDDDDTDTDE